MVDGERRETRRRTRVIGILLIVVGTAVVIPSAVKTVLPFTDVFTGPKITVPGEARVHLARGDYDVYERTDTGLLTIPPSAVDVTATDGTGVSTRGSGSNTTIEHGSVTYESAVRFTIRDAGDYDVRVSDVAAGEVMIARSFGSAFVDAALWMASGLTGFLIVVTGVALVLVSLLRRTRAIPATVGPGAAPGWYADPSSLAGLRYWDGYAWTTHTHQPGNT